MKTRKISLFLAVALGATALSGCGIYKKYNPEDSESELVKEYARALQERPDSLAFGNLSWQQVFTDPALVDLINSALVNNKDLDNARLNVSMAQAQLKGAKLSYLPSVALAPNGAGASYSGDKFNWTYQIPMSVSWEIDIFGKLLNSKRGAQAQLRQSEAYEQAVRSQIIGGVATCYYTIAALESQLALSRETAEVWRKSIDVMKNLKLAGRLNEAAVVQSTAQYYSILASITDIEVSLHEAQNSMSLLQNVMPQTWAVAPTAAMTAPEMLREAIPMVELAARPDVRAAEQNLAVAYYATSSARAAFYPSLNITANGGFTNLLGSFISNPGDWFVQLAGQLTAPLFSRGQNIARLEAAKATQQQALNNFEYSLMNAAAEVSEAMTIYNKAQEKQNLLRLQVENLEKSVEYTQELLTLGTSTYLEVLTAQQNLLAAQTAQINSSLTASRAVINLYQSLGGGR